MTILYRIIQRLDRRIARLKLAQRKLAKRLIDDRHLNKQLDSLTSIRARLVARLHREEKNDNDEN